MLLNTCIHGQVRVTSNGERTFGKGTDFEIGLFECAREKTRVTQILDGNSLVTFEAEVQEVEHLSNNGRGRFGKVPESG